MKRPHLLQTLEIIGDATVRFRRGDPAVEFGTAIAGDGVENEIRFHF